MELHWLVDILLACFSKKRDNGCEMGILSQEITLTPILDAYCNHDKVFWWFCLPVIINFGAKVSTILLMLLFACILYRYHHIKSTFSINKI